MKVKILVFLFAFLFLAAFAAPRHVVAKSKIESLLAELDALIDHRDEFLMRHEQRLDSLRRVLNNTSLQLRERYDVLSQLSDGYFSYQSDSAMRFMSENLALAERIGDEDLIVRSRSAIALCYGVNGRFLEAMQSLDGVRDTLELTVQTQEAFYVAQHRMYREMWHQSEPGAKRKLAREKELYYALRISEVTSDPVTRLYYGYMNAMGERDWPRAVVLCDSILRLCPPDSHDYAKAANHRAYLEEEMGGGDLHVVWLIRSAMADIQSAVRDYGALVGVSEYLLRMGDASRAMRYIRIAINDTRFYNSPVRSWRDMAILPQIEQAYQTHNARTRTMYIVLMIIATLFAVSAVVGVLFVMRQNRRLNAVQQTLRESNDKLSELMRSLRESNGRLSRQNVRIADANRIKEAYIGGFLKTISEYINKMADSCRYVNKMLRNDRIDELRKEFSRINIKDDELKEFYALFDTMFLELYPSFIEDFNCLLTDEGRIVVRREGSLTTELRIYALIRLGISDTTTIASLLHCSVSTVYNYRSRMRMLSRDTSRDFEQQVLLIGLGFDEPNKNHYRS